MLFGSTIPVIFATPYLSTTPSTFRFVLLDLLLFTSDIFPFNFETVVLNGSGRFLSSNVNEALFMFTGPIFSFVLDELSLLFVAFL